MTAKASNFRRAAATITVDETFREAIAAVAKAEGIPQATLLATYLMPVLREHKDVLPITYTMLTLENGHWVPPRTGAVWENPANAILHFTGASLAILRGSVYSNNEMFILKRPGKRAVWTWWRECVARVNKTLEPLYPDRWQIFARVVEQIRDRTMVFAGWSNGGFLVRMLKRPEAQAHKLDARLLAFCQAATLWFSSSAKDRDFWPMLRESLRRLMIADPTFYSWCSDVMLRVVKIPQIPSSDPMAELVVKQK